ncbi:hypothetical protein QOZ80_1BG0049010 [Eleusine coracana subsp. coracana]|nr:hypothetical protein QOZ80_1BG0049010 [Eleusine coracana subsp. coracana]
MAMDQSLKRKRGRPAGSKSTKSKMEQKMALVKQRLTLLDSSSSSSEDDKDDDYEPMDDEFGVVVAHQHQPIAIHCGDKEDEVSGVSRQKISASVHSKCGSAMARAQEVQAKLPTRHPSFVKEMLKSHVVQGFWLGLPAKFCNKHLPMSDTTIVLEDENGDNHDTTYLAAKQGLSGGWRGFAIKHFLKVGDVVVFELVDLGLEEEVPKFKVYIIRANEFTTADGAVSLLNLEVCKKGKLLKEEESGGNLLKYEEDPKVNTVHSGVPLIDANGIVSEAIDDIRMLDSDIEFEDVTSFSNFNIVVDRLVIDCKFHDHMRWTYYELCSSQKAFLNKHLLKQLNLTLVVGVIMETINVAEGIRACKGEASRGEDFLIWKKTLESFELLGMDVAFLLKRVNALLRLQTQSRNASDEWQKYEELRLDSARATKKVKTLELQLSGVKDVLQKMDADMQEMVSSAKKRDLAMQELASAPWGKRTPFVDRFVRFIMRDLTVENRAGPEKAQAVALLVSADEVVVFRCAVLGYQDTLYAHAHRHFYRDCRSFFSTMAEEHRHGATRTRTRASPSTGAGSSRRRRSFFSTRKSPTWAGRDKAGGHKG